MNHFVFGIYVHWPFCAAKCPYCDFNSHVRTQVPETEWLHAVEKELAFAASELIPAGAVVSSVFFGGGTPSLMKGSTVGAVLRCIDRNWSVSPDVEITLEANPSSVEADRFLDYRTGGVNRISLGIQSLDDAALRFLGRIHDSAEARRAVEIATRTFERVSLDLIYARPDQNVQGWSRELGEALSFGTEHMSLYQLTIEDGTPFSIMTRAGRLSPLDDDPAAELYEETQRVMNGGGLPAYEISNHARPGSECRHNLLYWKYANYIGVGPGAHGRIATGRAPLPTVTERNPERWLARVSACGHGFVPQRRMTPQEGSEEHLLMNLRLRDGLDREEYRGRWRRELNENRIRALCEAGFICDRDGRIRASSKGRLVLNALIGALLDETNPSAETSGGQG